MDLIDRQAAIALAKDIIVPIKDGTAYKYRCIDPDAIKELPSAQPEMIREIRKWINSDNRGSADYFIVDKIEEIINKYE